MNDGRSLIKERQDQIIEEFSFFPDWTEKYEYIIDLGKQLPPLDPAYKTEAFLVKGCQSQVWLHAFLKDNKLQLEADSDAIITKGIIALLVKIYNGLSPAEIAGSDLYMLEKIGLESHLSPTRANGLRSMVNHIRSFAERIQIDGNNTKNNDKIESHQDQMVEIIKTVYDPEIPVDIWELGLIYDLRIDEKGKVDIRMTLTSPACPVAESLPLEVQQKLLSLPFVTDVNLVLVWDPAWTKNRMSDEAKMALDMF